MTEVALQAVELVRRIEGACFAHPRQRYRSCGEEGRIPRHHRAVGIGQIIAALSAGPARCAQRRRGHHLRSADLEIVGIGTGRCPPDQMRLRVPVPLPAAGVHLARQRAAADACRGQDERKPRCASAALPCWARLGLASTPTSVPTSSPAASASASPSPARLPTAPRSSSPTSRPAHSIRHRREQVFSILRDIADQGQTVVVVTHDPALAARADRRIHIVDGKIAEITGQGGGELRL